MRAWPLLFMVGVACGGPAEAPPDLPAPITLQARFSAGEGVRLRDRAVVPPGDATADLTFAQAMVMSLRSPTPESLCTKGTFAALADVPTTGAACAAAPGTWTQHAYLDAATIHTVAESHAAGLGLLARDREHRALYRLRIIGDAYAVDTGARVVFELEPLQKE